MSFPSEGVYRGMITPDTLVGPEPGTVSVAAFQFKSNQNRSDDSEECSVNWIDDDYAIVNLASQVKVDRKTNEIYRQFRIGACQISLNQLDSVKAKYPSCFSYERAPKEHEENGNGPNPYHGNLLFLDPSQEGASVLKRQVQSVLAYMADVFIPRSELDKMVSGA